MRTTARLRAYEVEEGSGAYDEYKQKGTKTINAFMPLIRNNPIGLILRFEDPVERRLTRAPKLLDPTLQHDVTYRVFRRH